MKKLIASTLALGLISTSAYASKARTLALGEEAEDVFFVEDTRMIFMNSAHIHKHANSMFLEWGGAGYSPATNASLDIDSAPEAQGGFLRRSGNFVYGINLGNESNVAALLRIFASQPGGTHIKSSDNVTDFFFGGDHGVKWAVNLVHTSFESKDSTATPSGTQLKNEGLGTRIGMIYDNIEAYLNLGLKGESDAPSLAQKPKFKGDLGLQVGARYKFSDMIAHAALKKLEWKQTLGDPTAVETEGGFTRLDIGLGKKHMITGDDHWFYRVNFRKIDVELKYTTAPASFTNTILPLVVGYEGTAASWLKLRGSVTHNLYGKIEEKDVGTNLNSTSQIALLTGDYAVNGTDGERSIANSTTVKAGATLVFGDLSVDGMLGVLNVQGTSKLTLDTLLARTSMTYKF